MKNIVKMALLSAGIVLSLASCQKGTTPGNLAGKAVRFNAMSGSVSTRTEFSADGTQDGSSVDLFGRKILKHERINWVVGDAILVASDFATIYGDPSTKYATYTVAKVTPNGDISEAELDEKAGSEELFFNDEHDKYKFWGIYPATAGKGTDLVNAGASYTINGAQPVNDPTATASDPVTVDGVTKKLTTLSADMSEAVMLAAAEDQTTESVVMQFYPGFTAFEFTLNSLTSDLELATLELKNAAGKSLAGDVVATIKTGGNSTFECTASDNALKYTFPEGTKITKDDYLTFTVFALPEDIEGLDLKFTMADGEVQTAKLKQTVNGEKKDITFEKCKKHCLRGIAVKGGWNFKYLTLDIDVLKWVDVESDISSGDGVQATQFAMSFDDDAEHCLRYIKDPNDKDYRQCWVFNPNSVVTVKYKIMMPASTDASWSIEKCGDTSDFTVTVSSTSGETSTSGNTYSGSLSTGATYITMTITSTATTLKTLYFKTFVSDGTSTFSLDSETQLYDMRGYHYFIVNGNAATTFDDLNI